MNQQKSNKISIILFGVFLLLGLLLTVTRSLAVFITDYQWFDKNMYLSTFLVKIKTEAFIIIPLTILLTLGLYLYLKQLKSKYYSSAHIFYNARADKRIHHFMIFGSLLLSAFISFTLSNNLWLKIQLFINSKTFNVSDPIFNKDVSFYVFKLPLYEEILTSLIILMLTLASITVAFFMIIITIRQAAENTVQEIHFISPQQKFLSFFNNEVVKSVIFKLAFLGMITFWLIGFKYYLKSYELMYSTRGVVYGASYTDIHVTLNTYRILSILSILSGFVFLFALTKKKQKLAIAIPVLFVVVGISGGLIATVVQQLVVEPDEISKEQPYLEYNIKHTQEAYGLSTVEIKDFPVDQDLTWADIQDNDITISNIRINDQRPLEQTYNQIQGIRLYYKFSGIDLDRYQIGNQYLQVFISAREMEQNNLSEQAKTWINEHLKYTHGYGIVMSPVNSVTDEGQPELMIQNIPPVSTTDLVVTRPEIYFGENTNNYIVINTKEDEFDYPSGSDNKTTRYEGDAGIELSGLNRLLFSIRERSMKLFVSSVVTSESKVIMYRNIVQRVERIAPFITLDANPYLVLNQEDGRLYWIIDGYTTSQYYPYSETTQFNNHKVNYIRNSVKVVVDAYNGTTDYYIIDEEDPMIQVYDDIFSDLFKPFDDFPTGLASHVKYPQDYFDLQSQIYRSYHVNNPEVFYNGEDVWSIANEKYMDGVEPIKSNYVMFKLPDSEVEEFALIIPYTPIEKANMTSLLVARNDGDNYGKLYIYKFPKDKTIQGPMMIESRIDQNSDISPQFTLWGQEGSTVLRGNLIVVPVNNSIMYVEPIYLQADNPNSLPEMKRVIVAYQEKIIMAESLDLALAQIFELDELPIDIDPSDLSPELIELIEELQRLVDSSKANTIEQERILNQIKQIINEE